MHCTNCGKENEEGYQFCMYCGSELYKPESHTSESENKDSPVPPAKTPTPVQVKRKARNLDRRKLLKIAGITGAVLVTLVCIWAFVGFLGFQILKPADQLVYMIQEDAGESATAFMSIRENGKDNEEIYSENDGLQSAALYVDLFPWIAHTIFSPDGNTMAVGNSDGELLLLNRNSSEPVSIDMEDSGGFTGFGIANGFSPDGKYFGFTDVDNTSLVTRIIDLQGNEVASMDDSVFAGFFPDSQRAVVFESDQLQVEGIGTLDIRSGEYNYLASIDAGDAAYSIWYSAGATRISPDGRTIYYVDGKSLMSISSGGGASSTIYESDEGISYSYFSPDANKLAIVDTDGSTLYLYDVRRGEKLRITNDLEGLMFSPNGRYLAYTTNEGTSEKDLHISKSDGSDKIRIAKNANWFKFAFSPDGSQLAYIEGNSSQDGGSLYVVRLDGSKSVRLDTSVWSFRFIDNGRSIIYAKVGDMDRGNPESEIYRIRVTGRSKELLLQADDGLFTFIWPLP